MKMSMSITKSLLLRTVENVEEVEVRNVNVGVQVLDFNVLQVGDGCAQGSPC